MTKIYLISGLLVFSNPQCQYSRHEQGCLELFSGMECFEPTFRAAHHTLKMISNARSLKLQIQTYWVLEDIIISRKEEFEDFEYDISVGI